MPDGQAIYYKTDYAYPCDSYINTLLGTFLVRKTLQKIAEKYYSNDIKELHQGSTLVTSKNYPQLFNLYEKCIERLQLSKHCPLYVTNQLTGINALSIELGGEQMILISRRAVAQLSEEELLFILGHELGHCQYGHITCHTVLGLLNDMNKHEIFEKLGMSLTRQEAYIHYKELSSPHPLLQTRWEMLQKYANEVNR